MDKIILFREWLAKARKNVWKTPEDPFIRYVHEVLLTPRKYPEFYSEEQAMRDLHEAWSDAFDDFAKQLGERLTKPGAPQKRDFKVSLTAQKKSKAEPYSNKVECGPEELRKILFAMPKNPDLVLKDADREMKDDRSQWGVARLADTVTLEAENLAEFERAAGGTPWIGLVRIGCRVGKSEDLITLVQVSSQPLPGCKYVLLTSELKGGEPWHTGWLNRRFAAKADSAIKRWNGWTLAELKADKKLMLSDVGCYFGFFLVKAEGGGQSHFFSFRCASLNRSANAAFSNQVPDIELSKMSPEQKAIYHNLTHVARNESTLPDETLDEQFKGIKRKRGVLDMQNSSKKMPLSWARQVYETINKRHAPAK